LRPSSEHALEPEISSQPPDRNFYTNDKPTGAVVGQPFGGSCASGTNDKAGSAGNLLRWVSLRTVKETFVPPTNYRCPFLVKDQEISPTGRVAASSPARASRTITFDACERNQVSLRYS
jgi:delta 1-pyrroline-5-carboxylate dehydrogenase